MDSLSFSFKLKDLKTFSAQFKIDYLERKAINIYKKNKDNLNN